MKQLIANITGGYSSSAKVVDGNLIISLPDAISPVVWRMELGHAKASALEVKENKDGQYILVLKTPKGDMHDIAPFASKAKAVKALMGISRAMENAHGKIIPQTIANDETGKTVETAPAIVTTSTKESRAGKWITGILGIAVLVILINVLMSMTPGRPPLPDNVSATGSSAGLGDTNANSAGVPVSADDFLMKR